MFVTRSNNIKDILTHTVPPSLRWLLPCVLVLILILCHAIPMTGMHVFAPAPIVYTGNGNTAQVGFITDINNDQLQDVVLTYYQRDYNFASTVIYLNNGCEFVRHSNPLEPVVYCKQYFLNQKMIKWETDPPVVTLHIPNDTFSGVIALPYHPIEIPAIIFAMSGVKIGTPMEKFYKGDTQVQYHAIQKSDDIYIGQPGPPSSSSSSSSGGSGGSGGGSSDNSGGGGGGAGGGGGGEGGSVSSSSSSGGSGGSGGSSGGGEAGGGGGTTGGTGRGTEGTGRGSSSSS
ncbi:hypothetical protein FDP41_012496 [Naegleria fowleri]|uniref:Uncharacterized protein n=1 Tax=Naegleria fowleri TaxID=5763 RepID=A0A6A5C134_NAEFO|nr:uncharacterized protein FDP41_012496 [Naegleria fowleri]KAF0981386.1 hypothetical protein FDP41_012496 [Naegleria fowleri]